MWNTSVSRAMTSRLGLELPTKHSTFMTCFNIISQFSLINDPMLRCQSQVPTFTFPLPEGHCETPPQVSVKDTFTLPMEVQNSGPGSNIANGSYHHRWLACNHFQGHRCKFTRESWKAYLAHSLIHYIQADSGMFHPRGHMEMILAQVHTYNSVNILHHSYQQGKLQLCAQKRAAT